MKEKFKKNLLYIIAGASAFIGLIFMIALIVVNSKPVTLNKQYTYSLNSFGSEYYIEATATFEDNYMTYSAYAGTESTTTTCEYRINNNNQLFLKVDADDWKLFGKINAFEIELDKSITNSNGIQLKIVLECKSAKIANGFNITFTVLGLTAGVVLAVVKFYLDKKANNIIEIKNKEQ